MHMRLNKAKLRTYGAETRSLLNLTQVVTGGGFLCRVTATATVVS